MMQNGIDESFWDGLGVEIGACANFGPKKLFWKTAKIYRNWMLGVDHPASFRATKPNKASMTLMLAAAMI